VVSVFDMRILRRHRRQGVSSNWSDPRPDLYRLEFSWEPPASQGSVRQET